MGKIKKGMAKKRQVVVLVLIGSLMLILGAGAWWYLTHGKSATDSSTQKETEMSDINAIVTDGRRSIEENDIKAGEARYDAALKSTNDEGVTIQLLLAQIDFYIQAGATDKAIAVAKEATEKYPNKTAVHVAAAHVYEAKGSKTEAIAEYRRTLEIMGKPEASNPDAPARSRTNPRAYYEARIQELSQ
jgi:predicted Zn-dependent protease